MSPPPSTSVKVPGSATTYTPATIDPDLRSQVNTLLLKDGHIDKIQDSLLHALNAHTSNWPSAVQSHALALLRSGEISTFPVLVRRVLEDVRHETASSPSAAHDNNNNGINGAAAPNGTGSANGTKALNGTLRAEGAAGGVGGNPGRLAIPVPVVEAVLKATRESLENVCEIEEGSS